MAGFKYEQGLEEILTTLVKSLDGAKDLDGGLISVIAAIGKASSAIGNHLRQAGGPSKAGTENVFGDEQLDVDLASDKITFDELKVYSAVLLEQSLIMFVPRVTERQQTFNKTRNRCGAVAIAASEETPVETPMGGTHESLYSVGFDPLDGSSIISANFAVGSIFGIWPGEKLLGRTGKEQVASCVAQYGPRTTMAIALSTEAIDRAPVALEVTFQPDAERWVVSREGLGLFSTGKIFAPGNLRATGDNPRYKKLVEHWISKSYTLRYTGGMVPDVYHILTKSKGVFANVSSHSAKAKLRLLYECAPIALLVEAAGGSSVVAPGEAGDVPISVLDVEIDDLDKRLGICVGSSEEVQTFIQYMFSNVD